MTTLQYKNRRNEVKQCIVTEHAAKRFKYRYRALLNHHKNGGQFKHSNVLFKKDLLDLFHKDPVELLTYIFNRPESKRITLNDLGGSERKRMYGRNKKYGGYLRLRVWLWDFIIQDGELKTAEINNEELRHLNDYMPPINKMVSINDPVVMRLNALDKKMRTRRWIESEIIYESHIGIYTVHDCECNRGPCRSRHCVKCWQEMLELVTK